LHLYPAIGSLALKIRLANINRFSSAFYRISVPYPFQWGAPTFDAGEAFAMMAASFVALVEVLWIYLWFLGGGAVC
jgi:hypothetical protein